MGDDNGRGIWMPALCFGVLLLGSWMGSTIEKLSWQKEAVEYGYAEYDSKTGDWQWKEK